jgi:hypothetical protein
MPSRPALAASSDRLVLGFRGRMMSIGAGVCLALRLVAAWQHSGLPRAGAI